VVAVVVCLLGLAIGTFGFLVMRNPMRLAFLSSQEGYYQRMVLDTTARIQLRVLGVLVCLFGSTIFTASLGSALKLSPLSAVSDGLLVLMGLIFFTAWAVGLILTIRQLIKGTLFDWWKMWRVSAELGPIDVFPLVTPKMQKEARFFTIALLSLALIAATAALLGQLS
jgi:hypothetical protein